jgi:hypothetical protein
MVRLKLLSALTSWPATAAAAAIDTKPAVTQARRGMRPSSQAIVREHYAAAPKSLATAIL